MTNPAAVQPPTAPPAPDFKRAVALTSVTSLLAPVVGLLSQPILARALGATGRGELVAASTLTLVVASIAALGLPNAVTYLVARQPQDTRRTLVVCLLCLTVIGALATAVSWLLIPWLSGGSTTLVSLMHLALYLVMPSLWMSALRGSATGNQRWSLMAAEGAANALLRVVVLLVLWAAGWLTAQAALILFMCSPMITGLVYLSELKKPALIGPSMTLRQTTGTLWSYGIAAWMGSIASTVMARVDQILMTPLSSARALGLFNVAHTIADLPFVLTGAVSSAVVGVNSRTPNGEQIAKATRVCLLMTIGVAVAVGGTSPLWLVPLFGAEFSGAVGPTLLLFVASIIGVPGVVASGTMAALGRPGLSSLGNVITCLFNAALFVALVPQFDLYGACAVAVLSASLLSGWMISCAARLTGLPRRKFFLVEVSDIATLSRVGHRVLQQLTAIVRRALPAR